MLSAAKSSTLRYSMASYLSPSGALWIGLPKEASNSNKETVTNIISRRMLPVKSICPCNRHRISSNRYKL